MPEEMQEGYPKQSSPDSPKYLLVQREISWKDLPMVANRTMTAVVIPKDAPPPPEWIEKLAAARAESLRAEVRDAGAEESEAAIAVALETFYMLGVRMQRELANSTKGEVRP